MFRHPISQLTSLYCSLGGYTSRRPLSFARQILQGKRTALLSIAKRWTDRIASKRFVALRYENYETIMSPLEKWAGLPSTEDGEHPERARASIFPDLALLNARLLLRLSGYMDDQDYRQKIYNAIVDFGSSDEYNELRAKENGPAYGILTRSEQEEVLGDIGNDLAELEHYIEPLRDGPTPCYMPIVSEKPDEAHIDELEALFWSSMLPRRVVDYVR